MNLIFKYDTLVKHIVESFQNLEWWKYEIYMH